MTTTARRPRLLLTMAMAISAASLATAQGPGGRGGWGGPGGPGGRGGPGGPGGGSITGLLQNTAVQEELKLSPAQIEKVSKINEASNKKRGEVVAQFRPNGGNNGGGNNPGGGNNAGGGNNPGANNAGGNNGGRRNRGNNQPGATPANPDEAGGAPAQNGGGQGQNGGFNGGGPPGFGPGGRGGNSNMTEEERAAMQERMATMRAAMTGLQKDTEAMIAKVLDAKQRTRLAQIHLQSQRLNAFTTPELAQKLNLNEDTVAQIREILDGQNEARRSQFAKMGEVFAQFAGGNVGRPGREEMQALRENPEFQKKMDETRKESDAANKTFEEKAKLQVGRLLSKKQKDTYAKLTGAPFDLAKLNNGRGGPNRGPNGNANANGPTPAAGSAPNAGQSPAASPDQPARKSLRDRRSGSTTG